MFWRRLLIMAFRFYFELFTVFIREIVSVQWVAGRYLKFIFLEVKITKVKIPNVKFPITNFLKVKILNANFSNASRLKFLKIEIHCFGLTKITKNCQNYLKISNPDPYEQNFPKIGTNYNKSVDKVSSSWMIQLATVLKL